MIVGGPGQNCKTCGRYRGVRVCEAFPDEIPEAIWAGENTHIHPYPGDGGLTRTVPPEWEVDRSLDSYARMAAKLRSARRQS